VFEPRSSVALLAFVAGLACAGLAACAPTERYYTNKTPEPPPSAGKLGPCRMATPVTQLQSRASNQRSVEGFNSFPCASSPAPPSR
jgi:hypothetical protein